MYLYNNLRTYFANSNSWVWQSVWLFIHSQLKLRSRFYIDKDKGTYFQPYPSNEVVLRDCVLVPDLNIESLYHHRSQTLTLKYGINKGSVTKPWILSRGLFEVNKHKKCLRLCTVFTSIHRTSNVTSSAPAGFVTCQIMVKQVVSRVHKNMLLNILTIFRHCGEVASWSHWEYESWRRLVELWMFGFVVGDRGLRHFPATDNLSING